MKSNIDLTSNEMFSRESVSLQFNFIIKHIYGLPWDMSKVAITKNDSDLIPKFEGIRTGDKRCRELKKAPEIIVIAVVLILKQFRGIELMDCVRSVWHITLKRIGQKKIYPGVSHKK